MDLLGCRQCGTRVAIRTRRAGDSARTCPRCGSPLSLLARGAGAQRLRLWPPLASGPGRTLA
jgi:uncharacterized paraquat-inducible protein A